MSLHATGNQTVGPYLHIGLNWLVTENIAGPGIAGERFAIQGRVLDGDGAGVADAMIEIWQTNAHGKYAHPEDKQKKPLERGFKGFGRVPTDSKGMFKFTTIKPGSVPGPGGRIQAPHLLVSVFMRGLLKHLATRIYFPDEPANAKDPVLKLVPSNRRVTLIAKRKSKNKLEWDVVLQGKSETIFFEY